MNNSHFVGDSCRHKHLSEGGGIGTVFLLTEIAVGKVSPVSKMAKGKVQRC